MEDLNMRTNFDFAPFRRSTVGFDQLFDMLERGATAPVNEGYPPFDIEQESEDKYRITLAVAGFKIEEIDITALQNQLIVAGQRGEAEDRNYLHRGIAARSFERRFALGDFIKVKGAELRDGLLSIDLLREIPEEMKPHKVDILRAGHDQVEDRRDAARPADNENAGGDVAA
jgi:molecular chaperone IbpA